MSTRDIVRRARARTARSVASSRGAIALAERLGAHTVADRLERRRSGEEVVAIRVRPGIHEWRSRRVKARRRSGRDQCVEALYQNGWWGYERPLPDVLLATLRQRRGAMFDVGANTGVYALIASTVRGVTVHAFEAYPPVARMLVENVALNRAAGRIRLVECAVSHVDGEIQLFVPPESDLIETSSSIEAGFREGSAPMTVPATRLDRYWSANGRPAVAAIKVDVEGAEHLVLDGARELVAAERPVVFLEVLPGAAFEALEGFRASLDLVDVRLSQGEAVVGDRIIHDGLAWNHAFVPAERLEAFLDLLPHVGVAVTRR